MANPQRMIQPQLVGGFGQQKSEPHGGLNQREYAARTRALSSLGRVRILCVVGGNDYRSKISIEEQITERLEKDPKADTTEGLDENKRGPGDASPKRDGWFFSDFYYLRHIFAEVAEPQHQRWLTSVAPDHLVKKYGSFVHGDPYQPGDRRVVLNEDLLPNARDVVVVQPDDLKSHFLTTLQTWSTEVKEQGQQLLVIILSYGDDREGGFRLLVGGRGDIQIPTQSNRLDIAEVQRAICPGSRTTLLLTACFSGGWVMSPQLPNISIMSAVPDHVESVSFKRSITPMKRFCGSRYATAITRSILKASIPGIEVVDDDRDNLEDGILGVTGPSFVGLAEIVREIMAPLDTAREDVHPMFAAQDDAWDQDWRLLSGFRETDIQQRRDMLPLVSTSVSAPLAQQSQPSQSASTRVVTIGTTDQPLLYEQALSYARMRVRLYLNSEPGPDHQARNHSLHSSCRAFLELQSPSAQTIMAIARQVDYRLLDVMLMATTYRNALKVDFPACEAIDAFNYQPYPGQTGPSAYKEIKQECYKQAWNMVCDAKLFDKPNEDEGFEYNKGKHYLAHMMSFQLWSTASMEEAIKSMQKFRALYDKAQTTVEGFELQRNPRVRASLNEVAEKGRKRLRSMSPRKSFRRLRKSLKRE